MAPAQRGSPVAGGSRAVLALGSNLAPREKWLSLGREHLAASAEIEAETPRWNTLAIGGPSQPDFLNQLLLVRAERSGDAWLDLCHQLEAAAARRRLVSHGPRTLDVDVVLLEGPLLPGPRLKVPHPALRQRPFLLRGAALLVPDWIEPGSGRRIVDLAQETLSGAWALAGDAAAAARRPRRA
ncbi:MAG: 2-amino-4-hydroxy-6-hydroxymethyldihydropteridine diphosphokinase [Candidatus Dormibacteria bacterium]